MRAAIDLGSNSVLLTVLDGRRVLHDEARVVGLGRGLGDGGPFRADRMEATLAALGDYARTAAGFGVQPGEVVAIATSASRRATNAEAFYAQVQAQTGMCFRIVSGAEEARLTFLGARGDRSGEVAVIDLGGGSTEVAIGADDLRWRHSFELGSVRLTETVLGDPARVATSADVDRMAELSRMELPHQAPAVGVAGSVTTLAAAALQLTEWRAEAVHGAVLTDARLERFQSDLVGRDADRRRALFSVGAERADYLLAGATILRSALAALGEQELTVSVRGLRYGALVQ